MTGFPNSKLKNSYNSLYSEQSQISRLKFKVASNPQDFHSYIKLGQLYERQTKFKDAIDMYTFALFYLKKNILIKIKLKLKIRKLLKKQSKLEQDINLEGSNFFQLYNFIKVAVILIFLLPVIFDFIILVVSRNSNAIPPFEFFKKGYYSFAIHYTLIFGFSWAESLTNVIHGLRWKKKDRLYFHISEIALYLISWPVSFIILNSTDYKADDFIFFCAFVYKIFIPFFLFESLIQLVFNSIKKRKSEPYSEIDEEFKPELNVFLKFLSIFNVRNKY